MRQCSGCSYLVPDHWEECRRCGVALGQHAATTAIAVAPELPRPAAPPRLAPPPPMPTSAAPGLDRVLASQPSGIEFIAPHSMSNTPPDTQPAPEQRKTTARLLIGLIVVTVLFLGWWLVTRGDGPGAEVAGRAGDEEPAFVALPGVGADGLPTLADVTRIDGEATLQRATVIAMASAAEFGGHDVVDTELRASYDPSLQWLNGMTPSTAASEVSFVVFAPEDAVLSVWAGDGQCAVAHLTPIAVEKVTVRTEIGCAASNLPLEVFTS